MDSISFVIPCLNEAESLPRVLKKITKICSDQFAQYPAEIIISDNGSTDDSIRIAEQHGAVVVHCKQKGYGAALRYGISQAKHAIIVFADADDTYDFLEAPRLIEQLLKGSDLVLGSRLKGTMIKGSMPFLHKYLGTPVLNMIINGLYAEKGNKINDCNSGFRCFRKETFLTWGIAATGMEFASEMLVQALKHNARICSIPITFHPDHRNRIPNLKTWKDGMRHLLQILFDAPRFFYVTGLNIWLLSWVVMVISFLIGPISLGSAAVFGNHTFMFAALGSYIGQTIWGVGLFLSTKKNYEVKVYAKLIQLAEDKLFGLLLVLFAASFFALGFIVFDWWRHGFHGIYLEKQTLFLLTFASNSFLILANLFTAHLLKKV